MQVKSKLYKTAVPVLDDLLCRVCSWTPHYTFEASNVDLSFPSLAKQPAQRVVEFFGNSKSRSQPKAQLALMEKLLASANRGDEASVSQVLESLVTHSRLTLSVALMVTLEPLPVSPVAD